MKEETGEHGQAATSVALQWSVALLMCVLLALASYSLLAHRLVATRHDVALLELVARQGLRVRVAASLAGLLVDTPRRWSPPRRAEARDDLAEVVATLEAAHPRTVAAVRASAARDVLAASNPALDVAIRKLIANARALLATPDAELPARRGAARAFADAARVDAITADLTAIVHELRLAHEQALDDTRILGRMVFAADVVVLLLIAAGIAVPTVQRVHREIRDRDQANRLLAERGCELERSRASAIRMRELADLGRLDAECAREAAWTLVAIVRSSGDGIIGTTPDGTITSWNAGAERLYGHRAEDVLGKRLTLLLAPERREETATMLARLATGADVLRAETERVRADGSRVQVSVTLSAVKDADGRMVGASSIDRDVTEERAAEERFRIAVEAAPAAMLMVDAAGRIVLANVQAERLFGYARSELVGLSVDALVPERARPRHPRHRRHFLATPEVRSMGERDLTALRKDGGEVPIEIGLNPLVIRDETFVLSAIVDISERKRAEEALARQAAELARSNEELEQFAYVASHDLQEPLRMVGSYVQLLARRYRGQLDVEADGFIGYAVEGVKRMRALIDDLLALSRVGSRGMAITEVACDETLAAVLANLQVAIAETGATVTSDPLPRVQADGGLLAHLLQNLIENALKFRGDEPPCIHVGVAREPERWVFSVRDNGIGIEARHEERIFQVFQRLHTRARYPGTGIGLPLCRKIVERHGGTIWMRSVPGKGSTFSFTLPVVPAQMAAAGAAVPTDAVRA